MATFNNHEEFFAFMEADWDPEDLKRSEARLSRRVYKDTECGAWAALVPQSVFVTGTRLETWTFTYDLAKEDARLLYGEVGETVYPPDEMPVCVREYAAPTGIQQSSAEIFGLEGDGPRWARRLTREVERKTYCVQREGIMIGSIVEGSDAEVDTVPLRYPFTEEDWDNTVTYVEGMCDLLWHQANDEFTP